METYIAWSKVTGEGMTGERSHDCIVFEAEDEEEALEEFLDSEKSYLRRVKAVRIDSREYSHIDGKAEFEYKYKGKMVTLEIEMREAE